MELITFTSFGGLQLDVVSVAFGVAPIAVDVCSSEVTWWVGYKGTDVSEYTVFAFFLDARGTVQHDSVEYVWRVRTVVKVRKKEGTIKLSMYFVKVTPVQCLSKFKFFVQVDGISIVFNDVKKYGIHERTEFLVVADDDVK